MQIAEKQQACMAEELLMILFVSADLLTATDIRSLQHSIRPTYEAFCAQPLSIPVCTFYF